MKIKPAVVSTDEREQLIERALQEYDREQISLGRLAELLGIDRWDAAELVESRGMSVHFAPATVEEAIQDVRAVEKLR